MDKEEKEVKKATKKTTTTKKTTAKKQEPIKKEVKTATKKTTTKSSTTKKSTAKKETIKTVKKVEDKPKTTPAKKTTVKKVTKPKTVKEEEKVEKIIEVPVVKEEVKEQKVVTKNVPEKKISSELLEIRKKRYIIETIIVAVLVLIALLLLCNKTFLKTNYKTDSINVDIPRFSYYIEDEDNTVELVTLRKSDYLREYYNEYLEGFIFYSCAEGNNTFYYNEETRTLIKEIEVEKKFMIKTIEITYDSRTPEEVCGLR